jgi:hypothetical protein
VSSGKTFDGLFSAAVLFVSRGRLGTSTAARSWFGGDGDSLVATAAINPNQVDDYQSTPLYYACLCGHLDIVQYLLDNGANCNPATYEGARCVYGALTDTIRSLLISYDITKAVDVSQPYVAFFRRLCEERGESGDMDVHYGSRAIRVHRFVLVARTRLQLLDRVDVGQVDSDEALRMAVACLYTGQMNSRAEEWSESLEILERLRFKHDVRAMADMMSQEVARQALLQLQEDYEDYVQHHVIEPPTSLHGCDLIIHVQPRHYSINKCVLLQRCEYFSLMFQHPFSESTHSTLTLADLSHAVFEHVLQFIYTDTCHPPPHLLHDCLLASDRLLLDRMRSILVLAMTNAPEPVHDIYDMYRTAAFLHLERLEQYCCKYFAQHLLELVDTPEFIQLVRESASAIKKRQQVDSIILIDDIRYFIDQLYGITHDDDEDDFGDEVEREDVSVLKEWFRDYHAKLTALDRLLDTIGVDA